MSIHELRINRMPVSPNRKCEGCVHFEGQVSKGGACEVGTTPGVCGDGSEMRYGYAPLANLGPDQIDDFATPAMVGSVGAMNEEGQLESMIQMKRVVLGDEDLTVAERIYGDLSANAFKSERLAEVPIHAPFNYKGSTPEQPLLYRVAKSLYGELSPRKQKKFELHDVLDFLKGHGFEVTEADYGAAGERVNKGFMKQKEDGTPIQKPSLYQHARAAVGLPRNDIDGEGNPTKPKLPKATATIKPKVQKALSTKKGS
jgi:hypothetical protein